MDYANKTIQFQVTELPYSVLDKIMDPNIERELVLLGRTAWNGDGKPHWGIGYPVDPAIWDPYAESKKVDPYDTGNRDWQVDDIVTWPHPTMKTPAGDIIFKKGEPLRVTSVRTEKQSESDLYRDLLIQEVKLRGMYIGMDAPCFMCTSMWFHSGFFTKYVENPVEYPNKI